MDKPRVKKVRKRETSYINACIWNLEKWYWWTCLQGSKRLREQTYGHSKGRRKNKTAQSCLTLCGPMDYSPSGFSVHGIFQARILEWVAISPFRGSSWPSNWTRVSCVSWNGSWIVTIEPPGKPRNLSLSQLSLLQDFLYLQWSNRLPRWLSG